MSYILIGHSRDTNIFGETLINEFLHGLPCLGEGNVGWSKTREKLLS